MLRKLIKRFIKAVIEMLHTVSQALTPEAFCSLRATASFRPYSLEDAAAALAGTLYTAEVRDGGTTVGIARIVGDGRLAFFIKDVVVDPAYRGQGIGRMLMEVLFAYIRRHGCKSAYVGLMAAPGTEEFYERFGFIRRPAPGLGHGMVLFLDAEPPKPAEQ